MRLGVVDELTKRRGRHLQAAEQHRRDIGHTHDQCESRERIEVQLRKQELVDDEIAGGAEQQGVPVRRSLGDRLSAEHAGAPGAALNDQRLTEGTLDYRRE